jgi:hypothetical protein
MISGNKWIVYLARAGDIKVKIVIHPAEDTGLNPDEHPSCNYV